MLASEAKPGVERLPRKTHNYKLRRLICACRHRRQRRTGTTEYEPTSERFVALCLYGEAVPMITKRIDHCCGGEYSIAMGVAQSGKKCAIQLKMAGPHFSRLFAARHTGKMAIDEARLLVNEGT
jgi:hypothetical protein